MADSKLRLALVQMPVRTLALEENWERGSSFVRQAADAGADLVVLPELWTTGFHWPKNCRLVDEHPLWEESLMDLSQKYGVWIAGSTLAGSTESGVFNRATLISPEEGAVAHYAKMHLFSLTGEDRYLTPGNDVVCPETPWGKIGLAICYDVRFPELWRMLALEGARLILCPAGFPEPRQDHWRTLLRARAIENQCFVAGVNQVGTEQIAGGSALKYFGGSLLVDPWGEVMHEADANESLIIQDIDLSISDKVRQKMAVFPDRRPELYRLGL